MKHNRLAVALLVSLTFFTVPYTYSEIFQHKVSPPAMEGKRVQNREILDQSVYTDSEITDQFRCWQHGQLIVDKTGLDSLRVLSAHIVEQGSINLKVYDFGETFCLYIGEKPS